MVKEVEFSNTSEILAVSEQSANSEDQSLFEGVLKGEGLTLDIKVRVPLLSEAYAKRKLFLYFCNVDFDNKTSEFYKLGETDPDFCQNGGTEFTDKVYSFDLSSVLTVPRKVYNTKGTSEIIIESYTYEANFNTDYGVKRLSVPYSITSDSLYEYDKSTDGIYRMTMIDFEPWVDTRSYGIGDIVMVDGSLTLSTTDNNSDETTVLDSWSAVTDLDIANYSTGHTKWPPLRAIITDILISRYAKYGIIKDILLSTGFKDFDDAQAYETSILLQNFRERAKYSLIAHKPIQALYNLQMLKLASSQDNSTTKIYNYNINYTT